MSAQRPRLVLVAAVVAAGMIAASPAEVPPGCRLDDLSTSQLRVYECQQKLRIAAEAATRLSAIQRNGRLVGVRAEGGAVLVETGGRSEGFQIVTAQAVTEARDGRVAVETGPAGTAVFVREGGASVSHEGRSVRLKAGEGVDVAALPEPPPPPRPETSAQPAPRPVPPPSSPPRAERPPTRSVGGGRPGLEVKTWGAERAGRLMARLGQR